MEIASYLNGKSKSISIISKTETPFEKTLGSKIGGEIKNVMNVMFQIIIIYYYFILALFIKWYKLP